jgi:leucyl aminopeptidase
VSKRIDSPTVNVDVRELEIDEVDADLIVAGLYEGEEPPEALRGSAGASVAAGGYKKLTAIYPERPGRGLIVGLGRREEMDAERARVVAALAAKEAAALKASSIAWLLPSGGESDQAIAEGLVTGTILGAYRFDRFIGLDPDDPPPPRLEALTLLGPAELSGAAETARACAVAQNRARDLQSLPSNFATPSFLGERAAEIASAHPAVSAEVLGREQIAAQGMGGLIAVSQGGEEEPRLIVLRYSGGGGGPTLGLVGKGVTFDTGGISIKPSAGMHEMKMDMSGGAAVLEAVAAIAELELAVELLAVVPATENMPSGTAVKPGDVITQHNGKTVEVNNTDAEGRLILADALSYAVELGAERLVDLATLTGAVLVRPRLHLRGGDLQRRRAGGGGRGRRHGDRRARLAAPASPRVQGDDEGDRRRPLQPRLEARGRDDHRRVVPRGVRRRDALGARRHRRHRLGRRPRVHRQGRQRLRGPAAGRPRPLARRLSRSAPDGEPAAGRPRPLARRLSRSAPDRRGRDSSLGREDHAGRGPVGEQLARLGRGHRRLGRRLTAAAVEDVRRAEHTSGVARYRPHVLGL